MNKTFKRLSVMTLLAFAGYEYGIMSTQIQWMRADINRLEVQIAKVEARYEAKAKP
jgi:hypothetical protein